MKVVGMLMSMVQKLYESWAYESQEVPVYQGCEFSLIK